ncbi:hypothetical protein PG988_007582 [Apiospora saccharicola]
MAPLNFFGKLDTANDSGKDVTFHTANSSIKFTVTSGTSAHIGGSDDKTKADSIINVRFGKEAKEVFALTTDSSWPKEVVSADLTWEDGFLNIRGTTDQGVYKAVFNKKGPAA